MAKNTSKVSAPQEMPSPQGLQQHRATNSSDLDTEVQSNKPLFLNFTAELAPFSASKKQKKKSNVYKVSGVNILNRNSVDSKTALERLQRRRENHNFVERRRRDNINHTITTLSTLIPYCAEDGVKLNKGSILHMAVEYIQDLQDINAALSEENIRLGGSGTIDIPRRPNNSSTASLSKKYNDSTSSSERKDTPTSTAPSSPNALQPQSSNFGFPVDGTAQAVTSTVSGKSPSLLALSGITPSRSTATNSNSMSVPPSPIVSAPITSNSVQSKTSHPSSYPSPGDNTTTIECSNASSGRAMFPPFAVMTAHSHHHHQSQTSGTLSPPVTTAAPSGAPSTNTSPMALTATSVSGQVRSIPPVTQLPPTSGFPGSTSNTPLKVADSTNDTLLPPPIRSVSHSPAVSGQQGHQYNQCSAPLQNAPQQQQQQQQFSAVPALPPLSESAPALTTVQTTEGPRQTPYQYSFPAVVALSGASSRYAKPAQSMPTSPNFHPRGGSGRISDFSLNSNGNPMGNGVNGMPSSAAISNHPFFRATSNNNHVKNEDISSIRHYLHNGSRGQQQGVPSAAQSKTVLGPSSGYNDYYVQQQQQQKQQQQQQSTGMPIRKNSFNSLARQHPYALRQGGIPAVAQSLQSTPLMRAHREQSMMGGPECFDLPPVVAPRVSLQQQQQQQQQHTHLVSGNSNRVPQQIQSPTNTH